MTVTRSVVLEDIVGVKRTVINLKGDVVSIELHCGDDYVARVLFEDLEERVSRGQVYVAFGRNGNGVRTGEKK